MTDDASEFIFADERYGRLARELAESYRRADPFPHVVIDDFLPEGVCRRILEEFPDPRGVDWIRRDRNAAIKLGFRDETKIGPATRSVLWQLNSSSFVRFLERLTGIRGLIPDPHFEGGGLHQIERGGFLKVHIDFNRHPELSLERRLNFLLYLNEDWKEEYGGHLELWDRTSSRCVKRVLPVFNRCVLINTTHYSFHGHPVPLACPPDRTRKSLALYYFTRSRPADEQSRSRPTLYVDEGDRKGVFFRSRRVAANALDLASRVLAAPSRALRRASDRIDPTRLHP